MQYLAEEGYKIRLENFFGPLDLLLHLVKEREIDIFKIRLEEVAQQYLVYIEMLRKLDINLASDFIILASQLMYIKLRSLLPAPSHEEEEDKITIELIKKLLLYKEYKEKASGLERLRFERSQRFGRPSQKISKGEELFEAELWDLVLTYAKLLRQITLDIPLSILYTDIPIEKFIERIKELLQKKPKRLFSELVEKEDKASIIGTFLAVLELAKQGEIFTRQSQKENDIIIEVKVA